MPNTKNKIKICLLGSGFGSITVLTTLKKHLRTDHDNVNIQLISDQDYFLFTPLLHEVATGEIKAENIVYPVEKLKEKHFDFIFTKTKVKEICPDKRSVITEVGDFEYDYLVVALGSTSNFYGNELLQQKTIEIKSLKDAEKIRAKITEELEQADKENNIEETQARCTFVIVGGGATGVEFSGGLSGLIADLLKRRKNLTKEQIKIYLLEMRDNLLGELGNKDFSLKALDYLKLLNIEVLTAHKLVDFDGEIAKIGDLKTGKQFTLKTNTIVWTAGVKPVKEIESAKLPKDNKGRLLTDKYLSVKGFPEIYALGDNACVEGEDNLTTAQSAIQQGKIVANNLLAKRKLFTFSKKYNYFHQGSLVTVGRKYGLNDLFGVKITGKSGWLIWKIIHLVKMMGTDTKIKVFLDWLLNFVQRKYF